MHAGSRKYTETTIVPPPYPPSGDQSLATAGADAGSVEPVATTPGGSPSPERKARGKKPWKRRVNNKQRGKRIEKDARDALNDRFGLNCRRAQQYRGVAGSADLADVPGLSVEVKGRRSFSVLKFYQQAVASAKDGETPIVLMQPFRGDWYVLLRLEDWSHPGLARLGSPALAWEQAQRERAENLADGAGASIHESG